MKGYEAEPQRKDTPLIEVVKELAEPIKRILTELRPRIDSGEYKLLIGGDASGRLPALIFSKVIREIYKEKGFEVPRTFTTFIAGEYKPEEAPEIKEAKIKDHLYDNYLKQISSMNLNGDHPGKVLIVEDTVHTGHSIEPVTKALSDMGIKFDIATIAYSPSTFSNPRRLGGEIFYASDTTPKIYYNKEYSGVKKVRGDMFSTPNVSAESTQARIDVDKVAQEITREYLSQTE